MKRNIFALFMLSAFFLTQGLRASAEEDKILSPNGFSENGLRFAPLYNDDTSRTKLVEILNPETTDIASYGDGQHDKRVTVKLEKWGARAASGEMLRCFLIFKDEKVLGYVNLGSAELRSKGKPILEGGFLFKNSAENADVENAIRAVYLHYLKGHIGNGDIVADKFIYTIHWANPLFASMEKSGLILFNQEKMRAEDAEIRDCLQEEMSKGLLLGQKARFVFANGKFYEWEGNEYKDKALFYMLFASPSPSEKNAE